MPVKTEKPELACEVEKVEHVIKLAIEKSLSKNMKDKIESIYRWKQAVALLELEVFAKKYNPPKAFVETVKNLLEYCVEYCLKKSTASYPGCWRYEVLTPFNNWGEQFWKYYVDNRARFENFLLKYVAEKYGWKPL